MRIPQRVVTFLVLAFSLVISQALIAQETDDAAAATVTPIEEELIVVGSRVRGRSETDSPYLLT